MRLSPTHFLTGSDDSENLKIDVPVFIVGLQVGIFQLPICLIVVI